MMQMDRIIDFDKTFHNPFDTIIIEGGIGHGLCGDCERSNRIYSMSVQGTDYCC